MANLQWTPFVIPLFISTVISAILALYAWKRRPIVGTTSFTILMLAVAVWSLVYALRLMSADLAVKLFWAKVRYLGIVVVPTAWLAFVLEYTNREKWLTPRNIALLCVEPLAILLIVWTNDWHHWYWSHTKLMTSGSLQLLDATYGNARLLHAAYTYGALLVSTLLLFLTFLRLSNLYRGQAGVLLICSLMPLVGDVISSYDLISFPLDLTPLIFTLTGSTVLFGISRFGLFDIVPIARNAAIDSLNSGMVVLDLDNCVVDINSVAERIIGRPASEVIGQPFDQVMTGQTHLIERYRDVNEVHDEITLVRGKRDHHYDLHISALRDQRGRISGRLILVHDITERRKAEADLTAQKRLFESLVAIARATAKRTSLEETLQSAVNMATTLTEAELGSMFLLDGTGIVTHAVLARGKVLPKQRQDIVGSVMKEGLVGWVVRHRQPALINDTARDDRWVDLPDPPYSVRSALAIPIVSGSAVLGVLTLQHSEPSHFNTEHAYLIHSSADQIVLAIRNAQMYDEQRRLAAQQTTLYEALRAVGQHLDPETIAHAAMEAVAQLTGWPAVAMLLPNDAATHLVIQAGAGALAATEGQLVPINGGITGRAFQTAETQYVPDVSLDPDFVSYANLDTVLCCELAVPVQRGARILGVLDVASDLSAAFSDDDILLAKSLAEAIGLALDNARLYTEIHQYAADLSTLYTTARAISRSLVLEDVLSETLQSALTSLGFDVGLISLADPTDGHLFLAAERELPPAMSDWFQKDGFESMLCARVYNQGKLIAVGDIEQKTPLVRELEEQVPMAINMMRDLNLRAYSGIALLHQERSLGALGLFSHQPRTISVEDEALQTTIGRQIATAITNARLFQDIADEQSRLQALIESSRDGIILVGTDHHILVINAPAIDFLHLTGEPQDWVNQPIQDAITLLEHDAPRAAKAIRAEIDQTRMEDKLSGESECEVPPRAIHLISLPVLADSTPIGRLLVLRDVTEERLLERMRDDLVHAMVHDLRNPLTAIYGALSFLADDLEGVLTPTQKQLWDIALDNSQGMLQLIKAILEISRLENRQMPLDHTLIAMDDLVTSVLDSQLPLANDKKINLKSDVPSSLAPAWADERLIVRVLKNIIGNAIKFTPSGGEVCVTVTCAEAMQSRLLVTVCDTGLGIPPELEERLFQKFVTGQQRGRGSGLGLAFCKMVIEAHGERIWIKDTSENGTTFAFTLPIAPES
ncbi:MAG: GAF domain-containing protein [Chloroflexi bacterium]|nr:GAF domain-containing protein [Chloroflexota bacterium]